jgi:hypothetical protein
LGAAGVLYRFFKGSLLSQKICGDVGLRHSIDLDLLVRPGQIAGAAGILQADGGIPQCGYVN